MQKHLFSYARLFAALISGLVICLGLILWMLLQFPSDVSSIPANARYVQEASHAALF